MLRYTCWERLFFLLLVHGAGTITARLNYLHTVLVAELIGLLNQLLHLLHDGLVLLLVLLLVGSSLLLIAGRIVRHLLGLSLLLSIIPGVGDVVATDRAAATLLLLSLPSGFFQLFLKFVK